MKNYNGRHVYNPENVKDAIFNDTCGRDYTGKKKLLREENLELILITNVIRINEDLKVALKVLSNQRLVTRNIFVSPHDQNVIEVYGIVSDR